MPPTFCRLLLTLVFTLPLCALAQSSAEPGAATAVTAPAPINLDTVVVTGTLPAPSLWELTRGTKRVLIMGTLTPAPRQMTWYAPKVESRVAQAQEVLGPPGVSVSADVGLFGGLMLMPSYQRSKKNPDGKRLQKTCCRRRPTPAGRLPRPAIWATTGVWRRCVRCMRPRPCSTPRCDRSA